MAPNYVVVSVAFNKRTERTLVHSYGLYSSLHESIRAKDRMKKDLERDPNPDWQVALYARKVIDVKAMNEIEGES